MNRYDDLNQQIKHWTEYVKLHRKVYRNKPMAFAWFNRMVNLEIKIEMLKKERDNYATI